MDINEFDFEDWYDGSYEFISEEIGRARITTCLLCDKDSLSDDDYCEDHQRCIICGDNDDCGCEEEWSNKSNCCEAKMDTDLKICSNCKEHCESAWEYDNNLINK